MIGVFDSGIGGLTVLEEMKKVLPNEDYLFYADSLNNPYGEKSDTELYEITSNIVEYLRNENIAVKENTVHRYIEMLENAKSWAETTLGHWEYFEKDGKKDHKYVKDGVFKPIINEYQNGKFKFKLKHSAMGSCQGGKLSFWNCDITAPDGKTFLIGINSDIMLEFLLHTTLVDGISNDNIWLGRQNGNVGLLTGEVENFENIPFYELQNIYNISVHQNNQYFQLISEFL